VRNGMTCGKNLTPPGKLPTASCTEASRAATGSSSEKEYGDFELQFEFKLGERGNSGCALRAPMFGDPAFDGMELQMADVRYNPAAKESELTGGIYRAIKPTKRVYKPTSGTSMRSSSSGAD